MEQDYESMEPEVQEDEIGPLPCFDVMLEIRRIEMELRRESLIYICLLYFSTNRDGTVPFYRPVRSFSMPARRVMVSGVT